MEREPTDLEVGASEGDLESLSEIVEKHMGLYIHIATAFLPQGADQSVFADLVQEGVTRIILDISKYEPLRGEWRYWSGMTFRKGVYEYLRKGYMEIKMPETARVSFISDEVLSDEEYQQDPCKEMDNNTIKQELRRLLLLVRSEMPEAHHIVVRKLNGESYRAMKRNGLKMSRERASLLYDQALLYMRSATILDISDIISEE